MIPFRWYLESVPAILPLNLGISRLSGSSSAETSMELLYKILVGGLVFGAFAACFVSFFIAIYSFVALLSTAYHPDTSRRKKILLQLVPFLIVTPLVQPPEKKKYADRFAFSLAVFLVCMGGLMLFKQFGMSVK